jgi:hypothetical protein
MAAATIGQKQEMLLSARGSHVLMSCRRARHNGKLVASMQRNASRLFCPRARGVVVKFLFHKKATKGNLTYMMAAQHP